MRKKAFVKLEIDENKSEEIAIYELRVRDILEIGEEIMTMGRDAQQWEAFVTRWLPRCVSIDYERFLDFAPSELMQIKNTFMEVNESFLSILEGLGMGEMLEQLKESFRADWKQSFVSSSAPATMVS